MKLILPTLKKRRRNLRLRAKKILASRPESYAGVPLQAFVHATWETQQPEAIRDLLRTTLYKTKREALATTVGVS